eukprot:jgi/Chlat1/3482/Chrsp23S08820
MTRRAYRLQEFSAHSGTVNCLKIGRKSSGVLVTGGDDKKVNIWAIGKPNAIMSLAGHTSPVECVTFDSGEEVVVAGSSAGTLKLWDLEEAKVVRTLTGHRSNVISVDYHPFGEFFASGSLDTNLKIWDIRRKGCIHTYKGHTRGVQCTRFSPDGRWVVSGGQDGTVKLWDLTAGKLMHNFKDNDGPITSLDFHPQEFLLATGSSDKTCKFWDLETFERVATAGPEATGIRAVLFTPDGKTLLGASQESVKVWSWEPLRCYDSMEASWGKLADISLYDGKLLGCAFQQSFVSIWIVDLSKLSPFCVDRRASEQDSMLSGLGNLKFPPEAVSSPTPRPKVGNASLTARRWTDAPPSVSVAMKPSAQVSPDVSAAGQQRVARAIELQAEHKERRPTPEPQVEHRPTVEEPKVEGGAAVDYLAGDAHHEAPAVSAHVTRKRSTDVPVIVKTPSGTPRDADRPSTSGRDEGYDDFPVKQPHHSNGHSRASSAGRDFYEDRPVGGAQPLGLNIEEFLPKQNTRPDNGASDLSDEDVIQRMLQQNRTMGAILRTRLTNLQVVRTFWSKGDLRGAVDAMQKIAEHSVLVDVVSMLVQKPDIFTLEITAAMLPLLVDLLSNTRHERYLLVGISAASMLLNSFGSVISSTRYASPSVGVDLMAEARLERCTSCHESFIAMQAQLERLSRQGGELSKEAKKLLASIKEIL